MSDETGGGHGPEADERQTSVPNLAVRVVQVFTSPAALFDRLKTSPVWVDAVVLIVVLGLIVQVLIPEELIREAILARIPSDASPEQVEAAQGMVGVASTVRWIATVVLPPVMIAIIAGVLLLIFNVLRGGDASFRQLYSATAHANLIPAVGGLVTLPLILARQELQTTLALHLFAPGLDTGTYAYRFLSGIGLFGVWATVVLGIAVSRLYPKVSAGSAIAILLLLYVLAKAVMAVGGAA
jgi:hypothetical protein